MHGPSKTTSAGSNPAGQAIFLKEKNLKVFIKQINISTMKGMIVMLRSILSITTLEQKNNVTVIGGFLSQNSNPYAIDLEWMNNGQLLLVHENCKKA